ncbi:MAG: hypothetical protein HY332_25325 [Chloroflexi bacterium]|nr:hypothetical protein [Chloroflexota bacterium]
MKAKQAKRSGQAGVLEVVVLGGLTLLLLAGGGAVAASFGTAGLGQQRVVQGSFAPGGTAEYRGGTQQPVAPIAPQAPAAATVVRAP